MNINYPNTKLNNIYNSLYYIDNDVEITGSLKIDKNITVVDISANILYSDDIIATTAEIHHMDVTSINTTSINTTSINTTTINNMHIPPTIASDNEYFVNSGIKLEHNNSMVIQSLLGALYNPKILYPLSFLPFDSGALQSVHCKHMIETMMSRSLIVSSQIGIDISSVNGMFGSIIGSLPTIIQTGLSLITDGTINVDVNAFLNETSSNTLVVRDLTNLLTSAVASKILARDTFNKVIVNPNYLVPMEPVFVDANGYLITMGIGRPPPQPNDPMYPYDNLKKDVRLRDKLDSYDAKWTAQAIADAAILVACIAAATSSGGAAGGAAGATAGGASAAAVIAASEATLAYIKAAALASFETATSSSSAAKITAFESSTATSSAAKVTAFESTMTTSSAAKVTAFESTMTTSSAAKVTAFESTLTTAASAEVATTTTALGKAGVSTVTSTGVAISEQTAVALGAITAATAAATTSIMLFGGHGPKGDTGNNGNDGGQGPQGPAGPMPDMTPYSTTIINDNKYQTIENMSNYLLSSVAITTYQPLTNMNDYVLTTALSTYATNAMLNNYATTNTLNNTVSSLNMIYLTASQANTIYATISILSNYLTTANATLNYVPLSSLSNYLTTLNASSTYATIASLSDYSTISNLTATINATYSTINAQFLSISQANIIYATNTSLSSYLTTANAVSTYVPISTMLYYLTVQNASVLYAPLTSLDTYATTASLSSYLTNANAVSTYVPITSLSSYLTVQDAYNTYATHASLDTYLLNSWAIATYDTLAGNTTISGNKTYTGTLTLPNLTPLQYLYLNASGQIVSQTVAGSTFTGGTITNATICNALLTCNNSLTASGTFNFKLIAGSTFNVLSSTGGVLFGVQNTASPYSCGMDSLNISNGLTVVGASTFYGNVGMSVLTASTLTINDTLLVGTLSKFSGDVTMNGNLILDGYLTKECIGGGATAATNNGQFRAITSTTTGYGVIQRNDGGGYYFLITPLNSPLGTFNGLRPLFFNLSSGMVTMQNGLTVSSGLTIDSLIFNGTPTINCTGGGYNWSVGGVSIGYFDKYTTGTDFRINANNNLVLSAGSNIIANSNVLFGATGTGITGNNSSTYGNINTVGSKNGWAGYTTWNNFYFMSDGNQYGLLQNGNNWSIRAQGTQVYFDSSNYMFNALGQQTYVPNQVLIGTNGNQLQWGQQQSSFYQNGGVNWGGGIIIGSMYKASSNSMFRISGSISYYTGWSMTSVYMINFIHTTNALFDFKYSQSHYSNITGNHTSFPCMLQTDFLPAGTYNIFLVATQNIVTDTNDSLYLLTEIVPS